MTKLDDRIVDLERENAELRRRLDEAFAQHAATAEMLQVINASPGDLAPVFDAMLEKAMRLCEATIGTLWTFAEDGMRAAAVRGAPPEYAEFLKQGPLPPDAVQQRFVHGEPAIQIADLAASELYRSGYPLARAAVDLGGVQTLLVVALRKDDALLGQFSIYRKEVRPFTDKQIALLRNFAAQAVIAMENARLLTETRERTEELQESLEYQTATSEVLQVISRSTFDLDTILQTVVSSAYRLCRADQAVIFRNAGGEYRWAAGHEMAEGSAESERNAVIRPGRGTLIGRAVLEGRAVHIEDAWADPQYEAQTDARAAGTRSMLGVPLLREGAPIGAIGLARNRVEPFSERETQLVATFADQAAIAIENARLLGELRERTDDLQESLEYQTATSDVLKVISRSPVDLGAVFDFVCDTAARLCQVQAASIFRLENGVYRWVTGFGLNETYRAIEEASAVAPGKGTLVGRVALTGKTVHILDGWADPDYERKEELRISEHRTILGVPLLRDGVVLGVICLARKAVDAFSDKQIELVTTFADQAVIAIENVRLFDELRARTDDLTESLEYQTATSDVLKVISRSTFDLQLVLDTLCETAVRLCNAESGHLALPQGDDYRTAAVFSNSPEAAALVRRQSYGPGRGTAVGRALLERRVVQIEDIGADPEHAVKQAAVRGFIRTILAVPLLREGEPIGAFGLSRSRVEPFTEQQIELVRTFADQAVIAIENTRLITETREARDAAEGSLRELKTAQASLIQAEKMASLGQLTAGIAHEIKNPLNFVNNFASLSNELLAELKDIAAPALATLDADKRDEADETFGMLTGNLEKIVEHGKRADNIVKSMLAHSRGTSGERQIIDLNALLEESLNLAYHGARAQDQSFNITLERDLDKELKPIELVPQDMTRVFLNLFGNGFYAANKRARSNGAAGGNGSFRPVLHVATRDAGDTVEIKVRDNGTGIPPDIRDRLFQPFFTTKPTGEGTGLGLSISYDIVTQEHGGTIAVDSEEGQFTEFTIRLPRGS